MNTEDNTYDSSWDEDNEDLFDKMYAEWEDRDWESWLGLKLSIPFDVKRVEDVEGFGGRKSKKPFGIGHVMKVLSILEEDDLYGIIIEPYHHNEKGISYGHDYQVTDIGDKPASHISRKQIGTATQGRTREYRVVRHMDYVRLKKR